MDSISIVVPTLNRPAALARALASAQRQVCEGVEIAIIVVDNSADANARGAVEALAAQPGTSIRYLSEPRPGVANARNAGVRAAQTRWIAFLDDDEQAGEGWLAALVAAARHTGADAVFGPVEARAEGPGAIGVFAPYFGRRIDRPEAGDISDLAARLGTNNSMFDRARCLEGAEPFDVRLNSVGGEDSLLLKRLVLSGARFVWAPGARVVEWVPPRRLTWAYVRKRRFLSGQIRVFVLHMLRPARWPEIAAWMAVGAAQVAAGGAGMLALAPFKGEAKIRASVLFYGGLGKLLWMSRFRPSLYGPGLVS